MEIYPSEYQQLELNRYEKVFIRHASNDEHYGICFTYDNVLIYRK